MDSKIELKRDSRRQTHYMQFKEGMLKGGRSDEIGGGDLHAKTFDMRNKVEPEGTQVPKSIYRLIRQQKAKQASLNVVPLAPVVQQN